MATQKRPPFVSIIGNYFGIGSRMELAVRRAGLTPLRLSQPCVDCSIAVSAEVADVRTITIIAKDAHGDAIDYAENLELILYLSAAALDFVATGGSTGIAATVGKIQALVAKKSWKAITTAAGLLTVTWTDTGTEVAFLGVKLPNGRVVMSTALTNA